MNMFGKTCLIAAVTVLSALCEADDVAASVPNQTLPDAHSGENTPPLYTDMYGDYDSNQTNDDIIDIPIYFPSGALLETDDGGLYNKSDLVLPPTDVILPPTSPMYNMTMNGTKPALPTDRTFNTSTTSVNTPNVTLHQRQQMAVAVQEKQKQ